MKKRLRKRWLRRRIRGLTKGAIAPIARSAAVMPRQTGIAADVNEQATRYGNCLDCPDHQMFAARDPDDDFSVGTDVRCEAAGGRVVFHDSDSLFVRSNFATPKWCPRRCAGVQMAARGFSASPGMRRCCKNLGKTDGST